MISVLYVGGKEMSISQLSGMNVHLDYVQNGMIALAQSSQETLMQ